MCLYTGMKNRDYKEHAPGEYYHIYNRGNAKQDVFIDEEDYKFFLARLRQNIFPNEFKNHRTPPLPEGSFSLISYCLMPNHFHLLIRQNCDIPTSKLLLRVCTSYSKYSNKKYSQVGHLFQDQFKQINIGGNEYLVWLSAYIHLNPQTANIIKDASDYPWSSYSSFLMSTKPGMCDTGIVLEQFKNPAEYKKFSDEVGILIKERKDIPEGAADSLLD